MLPQAPQEKGRKKRTFVAEEMYHGLIFPQAE